MDEDDRLDFIEALGQEFHAALSPPVPEELIVPRDAYEVWVRAFGRLPGLEVLGSLTEAHLMHLRDECERYFECPSITIEHVRTAIVRTLARVGDDDLAEL